MPVPVSPPGEAVAVLTVIAEPPFELFVNVTLQLVPLALDAVPIVGAAGTTAPAAGVTLLDADDEREMPFAFVAVAVNV